MRSNSWCTPYRFVVVVTLSSGACTSRTSSRHGKRCRTSSSKESEQVNDGTCMVGDNQTSNQGVIALSKAINLVGKYWFFLSVLLLLAVSFYPYHHLKNHIKCPGLTKRTIWLLTHYLHSQQPCASRMAGDT